jgi:hypothetical protein
MSPPCAYFWESRRQIRKRPGSSYWRALADKNLKRRAVSTIVRREAFSRRLLRTRSAPDGPTRASAADRGDPGICSHGCRRRHDRRGLPDLSRTIRNRSPLGARARRAGCNQGRALCGDDLGRRPHGPDYPEVTRKSPASRRVGPFCERRLNSKRAGDFLPGAAVEARPPARARPPRATR